MASNVFKVIANGIVDLTSKVSGTSASFPFEVVTAFVDGVSTAFTYSNGVLDIPSYTSGTVKAEFVLYLIYNDVSQHAPKDPATPASDSVFWEDRVSRMPTFSSSINNFESGKIAFKTSNIAFTCLGGDWESILDRVDFVGTNISVYFNDVIIFDGFTNGSQVSNGRTTIIIKNQATVLDSECNWGDSDYLNRIDGSHSSSFYTGSSIPEKYYGTAIPFVIGDRMAYHDFEGQNVDSGQDITGAPPLVQLGANVTSRTVGVGFVCRVIPTSATTGIVCRIPSFQSLSSSLGTDTATSLSPKLYSKIINGSASAPTGMIPSQLIRQETTGANVGSRCLNINSTVYQLEASVTASVTWVQAHYDEELQLCSTEPATQTFDPATVVISYDVTDGGHRLVKISCPGVDFLKYDHYLVCSNVTGSITAPKVAQFILESHGLSVDSSTFDTVSALYPQKTCIQVGLGKQIQTVNQVIGQINAALLTYNKIPLSGNDITMGYINLSPSITDTLTDEQIRELSVSVTSDDVYSKIEFEPIYAKGTNYRDDVYDSKQNSEAESIYASVKTKTIAHVLTSKPSSRWQDVADYYGFPSPVVRFIFLESTLYEVGDYVTIDHSDFKGDIVITSITPRQIGSSITGKKIS